MTLNDVFQEQKRLNEKINSDLYNEIKDPEVRRQRFLDFELAMRQESAEAVDSLNWKWWKKDEDDWDNVKIELVDMLHLFSLFLSLLASCHRGFQPNACCPGLYEARSVKPRIRLIGSILYSRLRSI